jgi:guanylate kinase
MTVAFRKVVRSGLGCVSFAMNSRRSVQPPESDTRSPHAEPARLAPQPLLAPPCSVASPQNREQRLLSMPCTRKACIFNVSGPYAVGKDTVLNELLSAYGDRVYRVRTVTTRPVSTEADPSYEHASFEELRERTSVGRWIVNHQLSGRTAYATSVDEIERVLSKGLVCIHSIYAGAAGAGKLREIFGSRLFSIGLIPASGDVSEQLAVLRARLLGRNRDDPAAVEARLRHQVEPLRYVLDNPPVPTQDGIQRVFDRVLVNYDLQETVHGIVALFREVMFGGGAE